MTGNYRIVAVGDSYTYGWGVNIEETWLRRLEQMVSLPGRQTETINLGKPGTGPPFYAEITQTVVPLLEPDLILVGILQGNDIAHRVGRAGTIGLKTNSRTRFLYPNFVRTVEMMRLARSLETRTQERLLKRPQQRIMLTGQQILLRNFMRKCRQRKNNDLKVWMPK